MIPSTDNSLGHAARLCVVILLLLLVPVGLRALNARFGPTDIPASYLPALEGPRIRGAYEPDTREQLAELEADYVVIGDSMAGTRIHTTRLAQISGRSTTSVLQAGSGSAYWYLALKNWVIASGAPTKAVIIFFRDTNLTDVMFRLDEGFRWSIDRVALDTEEDLNAVIAARAGALRHNLRRAVNGAYGSDLARVWMEQGLTDRIARALIPSQRQRKDFTVRMNARFDFTHMRPFEAADYVSVGDDGTDFDRYVNRSVLPLMLRDARAAGITLVFVRVQRRPVGNRPPAQSTALRKYVDDLRAYIEANGGVFHDDTGDPNLPLEMYDDGDHVNIDWRVRYTENLYERIRARLP